MKCKPLELHCGEQILFAVVTNSSGIVQEGFIVKAWINDPDTSTVLTSVTDRNGMVSFPLTVKEEVDDQQHVGGCGHGNHQGHAAEGKPQQARDQQSD